MGDSFNGNKVQNIYKLIDIYSEFLNNEAIVTLKDILSGNNNNDTKNHY